MSDNRQGKLKHTHPNSFFSMLNLTKYIQQLPGQNRNRRVLANGQEVEILQISPVTSYWINGDAYHICEMRNKPQVM